MIVTDAKTGTVYKEDNQPLLVVKYEHIKVSRGSAQVKLRVKNLITGNTLEKCYGSTSKLEPADVARKNAQYLYKEGDRYIFMDPTTYDQFFIDEDTLGEPARFLTEGIVVQVQYFEDRPIAADLPITMIFEIEYTEPGYKGNTVSNVLKDATLNNGAKVKVPTFVKIGDKIKVDTRDGSYVSKA